MSNWTVEPTNLLGQPLAYPITPASTRITHAWNGARTLEISVSMTQPVASLISHGNTLVRAYQDHSDTRYLRFHGTVWAESEEYAQGGMLTIVTIDGWGALERAYSFATISSVDAGTALKNVIDTHKTTAQALSASAPGTRILTDSAYITATETISADYSANPTSLAAFARSIIDRDGGIDVDLAPIEYAAGDINRLVVTARDDTASPTFRFESGDGTLNNCTLSRSVGADQRVVRATAFGDGGLSATSTDLTELNTYGLLESHFSFSEITSSAVLSSRAAYERIVGTNPIGTVSIQPDATVTPYVDVAPGDIVGVRGVRGERSFYAEARVLEMTTVIDVQGERVDSITAGVRRLPGNDTERIAVANRQLATLARRSVA